MHQNQSIDLGPPPKKNPAYAPADNCTYICITFQIREKHDLVWSLNTDDPYSEDFSLSKPPNKGHKRRSLFCF